MREDVIVVVVGRMINRNGKSACIERMKKLLMEWHDDKTRQQWEWEGMREKELTLTFLLAHPEARNNTRHGI